MSRYSIEPRDCILVKEYGNLHFAKNMGKNIAKSTSKNLSSKYNQKHMDHAKQYIAGAFKISSKKQFKKHQK